MRIVRTSAFFPEDSGEVRCEWCGCDCSNGLTLAVRVKIIDDSSDMYGWNWIFVIVKDDDIKVRINGDYKDVESSMAELSYSGVDYYLENSYVSCMIVWRGELSEDEIGIVEDDGIVKTEDILLYLSFHDGEVVSVNAGSVSVRAGRYVLGDSVDGSYLCYVIKVMSNG